MGQAHSRIISYDGALITGSLAQAIEEVAARLAGTSAIVVIRGEPGTGKDLMARFIHLASSRNRHPFIKINCALPAERLASELFGHERGAFAEAHRRKLGKLEFANNGTLFLDEIDLLPRAIQPGLLQAVQTQGFRRLGGQEVLRVDVQVLASTTRGRPVTLGEDEFGEEAHRLTVLDLQLPPLRERKEDLPALATWFLARFNAQYHRTAALSPETLALFAEYPWPGNIRELEDTVRRLAVTGDPTPIHEEIRFRLRRPGSSRDIVEIA